MRNIYFFYFAFIFLKEVGGGGCHNNMKCILHMSTTTPVYLMMLNCLLFVCVCEINSRASFIKDTCRLPLTSSIKRKKKSYFVFFFFCFFFFGGGTSSLFP